MKRPTLLTASLAIGGLFALASVPTSMAQEANGPVGKPRSTNNRVDTESSTPPPVNSDYRKAAEGTLPTAPGTNVVAPTAPGAGNGLSGGKPGTGAGGAVDPATPAIPGRVADGQGDPAGGLQPGARNLDIERTGVNRRGMAAPAGMDVAMLIEHAVGMSIEASALQAIGEQAPDEASKALFDHSKQEMADAKAMLTRAASDGGAIPANSPTRKFYGAANNYMTTLGQLCNPSTAPTNMDKAQTAMVNHAVKHVLDAEHIRQFGQAYSGTPATDQLLKHAAMMKVGGTEILDKVAGDSTPDAAAPATPVLLAQRGKELIAAAAEASMGFGPGRMNGNAGASPTLSGPNANGAAFPPADPNPARLRDTRPEIIGGTTATGSPTAGTATGAEAAANVKSAKELPNGQLVVPTPSGTPGTGTSNYGEGNNNTPPTNSTAGARPR